MTLSKPEIEFARENSNLRIERPNEDKEVHVEPSSVDLHLGTKYAGYRKQKTPVRVDDEGSYPTLWTRENDSEIIISPGQFLLAHTEEVVTLSEKLVGYLQGRSSVGRLGLFVENAGLVDAGFRGDLTLELFNAGENSISLKPGMRICQITFHEHDYQPTVGYSDWNDNKYYDQRGPTPSRLYEDFE